MGSFKNKCESILAKSLNISAYRIKNNKHIKFEPGDCVVDVYKKGKLLAMNMERVCPKENWASSSKSYAKKMAKNLHEKYNLEYKVIKFNKKSTPQGDVFTFVINRMEKILVLVIVLMLNLHTVKRLTKFLVQK